MKLKLLCLLGLFVCAATSPLPSPAAPVDAGTAALAARGWLQSDNRLAPTCGRGVADVATAEADGSQLYHVVLLDGGGFVVLSADDDLEPIVAFAAAGTFPDDSTSALAALLSRDARCRRNALADGNLTKHAVCAAEPGGGSASKWSRLLSAGAIAESTPGIAHSVRTLVTSGLENLDDVRVGPLMSTHWGQTTDTGYYNTGELCYNLYTPGNAPCGCGATALAQIIRYWRYPAAAIANTYRCTAEGASLALTVSGDTYDYAAMVDDPALASTAAQRAAIGRLAADCAIALNSSFTADWASSIAAYAHLPLQSTFRYANAVAYCKEIDMTAQSRAAILANCDAGAPVLLNVTDGRNDYHAVVADGYGYQGSTLYVHVNLGWTSTIGGDLWYNLPVITAGPADDVSRFTIIDSMVYNIFPGEAGKDILSGRVVEASGTPASGAVVVAYPSGSSIQCASAKTSAAGIYALLLEGGRYYDIACGTARRTKVWLPASVSPSKADPISGTYISGGMALGNSWGNDLTLDGAADPEPVDPEPADPEPADPEPAAPEIAYDFDCDLDGREFMLGAQVSLNVDIATVGCTVKSLRAKGLPSGLRLVYDRATQTYSITGTAKRAAAKPFTATLTLQVKPDNPKLKLAPLVKTYTFSVPPLPDWAVGTFSGVAWIGDTACPLSLTVKTTGAATGSITVGKKRYSISVKGYTTTADGALAIPLAPKRLDWSAELVLGTLRFGDSVVAGTMATGDRSAFATQHVWKFKECKRLLKSYRSPDKTLSWTTQGKFSYTAIAADGKKKERVSGYWLPESWNGNELRLVGYAIGPTTANCLKAVIDINNPANPEVEIVPLTPAISADPDGSSGDSQ